MSKNQDDKASKIEPNGEPQKEMPNGGRPFLYIGVSEDGNLGVSGYIQDKVLAYGMLEMAKEAIQNVHKKKEKQGIIKAPGEFLNSIKNLKKRF